jgi:hypothetical protein
MKILRLARILPIAAILAIASANAASAAEARPWLCRDKPVFSYERSMEYHATARLGRQWKLFFMQFQADAAHDGFDVVNSREIPARGEVLSGRLDPGRYFAVALYRGADGHWICPDYTHDNRDPKLGEVSNLCYGEGGPPCLVNLSVKPDHSLAQPSAPQMP